MPSSSDNESSSVHHFASIRRAIQNIRSDQVHATEMNNNDAQTQSRNSELELFQKQAHDRFHNLSAVNAHEFLSAAWTQKLLDHFLCCQEEFRIILSDNRSHLAKPPLDRILSDFFDKSIKALDICNATRDGIEKIRMWQKHLEIVICALDSKQKMISEGQLRRARKSLMELAILMLDDKERGSSVLSNRNRSFGHHGGSGKGNSNNHRQSSSGHSRSLSWSVSNSWSAAKQLQSIASSLVPPRANEVAATNGLAVGVYAASSILMFVLWTLVAAIPCQDRGLQAHFSIPRQFMWAPPLLLLHDQIMEESRKRGNRNSSGLLKEIVELVKCIQCMTDLLEQVQQFPMTDLQNEEVEMGVNELERAYRACKDGIDSLERQLREVFRKIMSCRTEGLEFLNKSNPTTTN